MIIIIFSSYFLPGSWLPSACCRPGSSWTHFLPGFSLSLSTFLGPTLKSTFKLKLKMHLNKSQSTFFITIFSPSFKNNFHFLYLIYFQWLQLRKLEMHLNNPQITSDEYRAEARVTFWKMVKRQDTAFILTIIMIRIIR